MFLLRLTTINEQQISTDFQIYFPCRGVRLHRTTAPMAGPFWDARAVGPADIGAPFAPADDAIETSREGAPPSLRMADSARSRHHYFQTDQTEGGGVNTRTNLDVPDGVPPTLSTSILPRRTACLWSPRWLPGTTTGTVATRQATPKAATGASRAGLLSTLLLVTPQPGSFVLIHPSILVGVVLVRAAD